MRVILRSAAQYKAFIELKNKRSYRKKLPNNFSVLNNEFSILEQICYNLLSHHKITWENFSDSCVLKYDLTIFNISQVIF